MLAVCRFDQFPKVHVSRIVPVGWPLSKNNVPGSGAIDDLFLVFVNVVIVIAVVIHVSPSSLSALLGPKGIDPSRMVFGFYIARV